MSKISVIIPVHNAAPYLRKNLDSVTKQTFKDLEIICVDDKSTDGSLGTLREYRNKDSRIKIIEFKKNKGVGAARNAGLKKATGEYVGFIDPDDWIDPDFYQKLYNAITSEKADIAKADIEENGRKTGLLERMTTESPLVFTYHVTGLFRRSFLSKNKLEYPTDLISAQDTVFLMSAIMKANKIALAPGTFYHYVKRDYGSGNSKYLSADKILSKTVSFERVLTILSNDNRFSDDVKVKFIDARIHFLLGGVFFGTTSESVRIDLCDRVIAAVNAVKYKEEIFKMGRTKPIRKYFECNDGAGLAKYLTYRRLFDAILENL